MPNKLFFYGNAAAIGGGGAWFRVAAADLHRRRPDHVELRRWLVDTGFVALDACGHSPSAARLS